jgi:hypothetical protein
MRKHFKNLVSTLLHKFYVLILIMRFSLRLIWRGLIHDNSKLCADEFVGFASVIDRLNTSTYGKPDYDQSKDMIKKTLQLHYSRNRHHPEYFSGLNQMNFLDIIEMYFDWRAATKRHRSGNIARSINLNQERFKIADQLKDILENTAMDELGRVRYLKLKMGMDLDGNKHS